MIKDLQPFLKTGGQGVYGCPACHGQLLHQVRTGIRKLKSELPPDCFPGTGGGYSHNKKKRLWQKNHNRIKSNGAGTRI
ncbi:MAG: hypothetical protein DSY70_08855 [Desulfobulbus sp.]|nr:MAG: hypothetical protein DSY70_08855 [Desulfobulbus sp.]